MMRMPNIFKNESEHRLLCLDWGINTLSHTHTTAQKIVPPSSVVTFTDALVVLWAPLDTCNETR